MSLVTWWLDRNIRISADVLRESFVRMSGPALVSLLGLTKNGHVVS